MSRQVTVVTPENIPLTLELAGLGTRFGALLVDLLIQTAIAIVGLIVFALLNAFAAGYVAILAPFALALGIGAGFLLIFGYYIFFEAIWNGQTPGKRIFAIRVVRDGGYPIGFFASAARNLVRIADSLPVSYAIGALAVFFNPEYKRLGDLVAGTVVIKERKAPVLKSLTAQETQTIQTARLPDTVKNPAQVLTDDELALLRRYSLRRWQMTPDDSERLAYRLIVPLIPRLNLTFQPGIPPRYADLVSTIVAVAERNNNQAENGAAERSPS